jgi:heme/copper-type cytochrome/quinol oxidase subunit 4
MNGSDRPPEGDNNNRANIAAAIFVVVLVVGAVWLFNKLNAANETLNCVASGRTNCADLAHPNAK